jgi:hypothetical protein
VTAPERIATTASGTYVLDPYVRDRLGRFADHPTQPLPPLADLEAVATVRDLTQGNGGAWTTGADPSCTWRVRTIRDEDGRFQVLYLDS